MPNNPLSEMPLPRDTVLREAIRLPFLYPTNLSDPVRTRAQVATDSRAEALRWRAR